MKLKKTLLPALLAALLLASCADPLSAPVDEAAVSGGTGEHTVLFPADPNKGLALLSVSGAPSASRVVLPTLGGATYSYRWYAEAVDQEAVAEPLFSGDFIPDADSPLAIELEPALWTITVRAWKGDAPAEEAENPPVPAFVGRTELALGTGAALPLTVGLLPNGEGSGTFSYNVTFSSGTDFPDNIGYAFISLFPLDGGAPVDVIDLLYPTAPTTAPLIGTKTLAAGYYHITTSVNYKDGSTQKFAVKREVLYIYDDLISSYTVSFAVEDFTALLPAYDFYTMPVNDAMYAVRTFDTAAYTTIWSGDLNSLGEFMKRLPQNTPDTPYFIAITGHTVAGTETDIRSRLGPKEDSLRELFAATQGRYVFYDLSGCIGTSIPNVTFLEGRPYGDRVTGVILPDTVTSIGNNAFNGDTALMHIRLGPQVTKIGNYAFDGCRSLRSITLPSTLNTIGTNALANTGLLALDLPSKFYLLPITGCTSLRSMTLRYDNASYTCSMVADLTSLEAVYVPGSRLSAYEALVTPESANSAWKSFFAAYTQRTGSDGSDFFRVIPGTEVP
ncbi:MAG: leucine-rich repeat domain-containing protein [Treponema sp.]|jgi:hypothetical protein|nr:leucine-rich repeat domain-containing protein [Treponema sp.]